MDFAKMIEMEAARERTENGALVYGSTKNALLDLFALAGAMRERSAQEITELFDKAYTLSPLMSMRMLFYFRDIRGGQGERRVARILLVHCADHHRESLLRNLPLIARYGRFDDYYELIGTDLEEEMWELLRGQLDEDISRMEMGKGISLLAKWLKKADSKNEKTKKLGIYTAKKLGFSIYDYKRITVRLRRYLTVTEQLMSAGEWEKIDYGHVSSAAMFKNSGAYLRHDREGYLAYLQEAKKGKVKIHADALYPYELVRALRTAPSFDRMEALDAQWKALPDYVNSDANILVMADVSGSMIYNAKGRPFDSAVSLAMYFAEKNTGAFHDLFMTFSSEPSFVKVKGEDLWSRYESIAKASWGYSTDLKKALEKLLMLSVTGHVSAKEMPKAFVIISDMEFDVCEKDGLDVCYMDWIRKAFKDAGYELPMIVFWNVNARHNHMHADSSMDQVVLLSGQSASAFESLISFLDGDKTDPMEYLYHVLNAKRYQEVCA